MEIKCPFHPKYKAIRKPTADCWFCRNIYDLIEALRHYHEE